MEKELPLPSAPVFKENCGKRMGSGGSLKQQQRWMIKNSQQLQRNREGREIQRVVSLFITNSGSNECCNGGEKDRREREDDKRLELVKDESLWMERMNKWMMMMMSFRL